MREYKDRRDPTILLLTLMMVSGSDLYTLMQPHCENPYHMIAPD